MTALQGSDGSRRLVVTLKYLIYQGEEDLELTYYVGRYLGPRKVNIADIKEIFMAGMSRRSHWALGPYFVVYG